MIRRWKLLKKSLASARLRLNVPWAVFLRQGLIRQEEGWTILLENPEDNKNDRHNAYCFVSISVFMASLFSTVTGFGFALVAVPFLMPVLGAHETVVFIIFGTCLVKMIVLWNTRKHFEWHTVAVTVAGSVLGSLPGSYLLNAISPAYLQILLGTVLVIVLL